MEKKLTCRAMGFNCDYMVRDESEEAIVRKIADHIKTAHGVEPTEALGARARDLIRLVEV